MATTMAAGVPRAPADLRPGLLAASGGDGRRFCEAYSAAVDAWLRQMLATATVAVGADVDGIALLAVGGQGRRELCPGSDLDLVLVHTGQKRVAALADALWYPIWDSGFHLDHSVRTPRELSDMVGSDIKVALGQLTARLVAGDERLAARVIDETQQQWAGRPRRSLERLRVAVVERWERFGDLAFLLEPDLKQSRGGLRDIETLQAAAIAAPFVEPTVQDPRLAGAHATLLSVRVALHATSGRSADVLVRDSHVSVAEHVGYPDRAALVHDVATAARRVAWAADDAWHRVDSWLAGPGRRAGRDQQIEPGVILRDGEVAIEAGADVVSDTSIAFRLGAAAARLGNPIAHAALRRLEDEVAEPPTPWPAATRDALVRLLGCGRPGVGVLETLDHLGVLSRYVPEWELVRSKPQYSVYHRYTVDRHLLETASEAAALVRRVHRPDLLLVAGWLHDIGKGGAGDHTESGMRIVESIATRMGFDVPDVDTLVRLVRDHLLLADMATRRDIADTATIATVVERVASVDELELLAAMTEADGIATGLTAWTPWKAELVGALVDRARARLSGRPWETTDELPTPELRTLMAAGALRIVPEATALTVVAPDRPGLLAIVTGALALHRLPVRSAVAATEGQMAVERYELDTSLLGAPPAWARIEADIAHAFEDPELLDRRLADRARSARPPAVPRPAPFVLVDNDASDRATVVEVRAPDGRGVLYRIARAIASCGHDIASAKVLTLGDEVVDTFYVTDNRHAKVVDESALGRLRAAILAELERAW